MPSFVSGSDRCVLRQGTFTLGGRGTDALPFAPLAWQPAVALLTVSRAGPVLLRRTTAAVVVKVDGEPLGVAPVEIQHGAEIEFGGCRLSFDSLAVDGEAMEAELHSPVTEQAPARSVRKGRLVDSRTGRVVEISDKRVLIGREPGCDIVIDTRAVSRRHASITAVHGGWQLRDESANGTVVNGARVRGTRLLDDGDVITMSDVELRFACDAEQAGPLDVGLTEATALLDLSRIVGEAACRDPRRGSDHEYSATLEVVRGSFSGASFQIDKAVCSIGRGERNDIRIRDESISASHASLLRKGATWYVIDLRSVNGTFVDGYRIAGERELPPGAMLRVGSVEMVFRSFEEGTEVPRRERRRPGLLRWIASVLKPPIGEAA